MKRTYLYTVAYRMTQCDDVQTVSVIAPDKWSAYENALDVLMEKHAFSPYNMWVEGVTYQNGNYRQIAKGESMW